MPGSPRSPNAPRLDIEDGAAVVAFCEENAIDFVIVGPEAPLAAGVADRLREAGLLVFGPSAAAARLEASKAFTKEICDAAARPPRPMRISPRPTPPRPISEAQGAPIVVKADGLAAGKGVIVAEPSRRPEPPSTTCSAAPLARRAPRW
jgi:phosphoribosylamine--glycine ligase